MEKSKVFWVSLVYYYSEGENPSWSKLRTVYDKTTTNDYFRFPIIHVSFFNHRRRSSINLILIINLLSNMFTQGKAFHDSQSFEKK